ncbi:hypothetical protein TNIN_194021 [Trichonephila inaurata madagascariensis]|uniref:Uncharacterized protein n=1 Tax=Trichonephila inaurata madagascariensis TaxID=2747483 RepID=A0A8X6XGX1_9ARAC|nr:hypothetical protein TNIN_194021 [Trichonephila inaurata madagascariensis]
MAVIDVDASFRLLEDCFEKLKNVLDCAGNPTKSCVKVQELLWLILNMEARNIDVALVQEPHSYKGTLPGFPASYRIFFSHSLDIIKAAITVRNRNILTFLDLN